MEKSLVFFIALIIAAASYAQPVIQQQRVYGGDSYEKLGRLCLNEGGGLVIGGGSQSDTTGNRTAASKGGADYWIIKQDNKGNKIWEKAIGGSNGDWVNDIKPTLDGGYIIAGNSGSPASGDKTENNKGQINYWVVKINSKGEVKWDITIGGNEYDEPSSIEQTADSGYIVAGWTSSRRTGNHQELTNGPRDAWIVKLNKTGKIIWQNTIGGSGYDGITTSSINGTNNNHPVICKQTPDGGYLVGTVSDSPVSGDKTQNSRGHSDYWLVKLDTVGNVLWDKTIGGTGYDYLNAMIPTSDGGYLLGGYSDSPISYEKTAGSKGGLDYWIVKVNSAGVVQWDKTMGGDATDALQAMQQTSDGGFILAGLSASHKSHDKSGPNYGLSDYWVVKTDSLGNIIWDKTIGGSDEDECMDVKEVSPNTYYLGGNSMSGISGNKKVTNYGINDYWIVKLVYNTPALTSERVTSSKLSISNNKETANTKTFLAYPNPATAVLHIQNTGKATFILSDQSGKKLLNKTMDGNGELNVAAIPAGAYYLTNTTSGITQKVVIAK